MLRLLSFALLSLFLGCGASALDRQVTAATVTRVALDAAASSIEIVCDPQRVEAAENPADTARACLKAFEGHDSSRAAWNVWATAIIMSDGDEELLAAALRMAGPVLSLYGELAEFLATYDIALPALSFGGE